ncbi:MAG: FtsQ-type POTRA domain-containing protein [Clostridiales bacterium]|jgi:cell division septal protein FtsQ|nr:FtsQ-type POTRA domain-containing protein [Clostridiales bacterium]
MRKRYVLAFIAGALALAAVLFLFSPFFFIEEIVVDGNVNFTKEEIINRSGIVSSSNLFLLNTSEVRDSIMENLYIEDVAFKKEFPNKITLHVTERHLSGYVEYMQGKYLYIDENGRVLEIKTYFTEKLPIVSGLKFESARLGEVLEVDDANAFKVMVRYARLLSKYELADNVSRIDISDSDNTRIMLYHIEFNVGGDRDADEKIRTMKEIEANLPNVSIINGFIDLSVIRSQYICEILV